MALTDNQVNDLARSVAWAVKKFYEDPENVKKFEEWKKERENEKTE